MQVVCPTPTWSIKPIKIVGLDGKVIELSEWETLNADIEDTDLDIRWDAPNLEWQATDRSIWSKAYYEVQYGFDDVYDQILIGGELTTV